jgi:CRP-like cAMP-binding protein
MPVDPRPPDQHAHQRHHLSARARVGRALRTREDPPTLGPLERVLALRTLPLFHGVRPRQLAALAQHMRECVMRRGTVLYGAGDAMRHAYLLTDGRVREQCDGSAGAVCEAPAALGLVHVLAGRPAQTPAVAETDVAALVIDASALFYVLEEHFSVVLHVHAMLAAEIAAAQTRLACYAPPPADMGPAPMPTDSDEFDLVSCLLGLQRASELRGLGVAVLAALLRDHRQLRCAAGDELFAAGAHTSSFIVLARGEVRCTPSTSEGHFRAQPGDLLGRDAALAGLAHQYTAVAETPVAALAIDAQVFWDVAEDHFHVSRAALAMSAAHLLWLQDRCAAGSTAAAPSAVASPSERA